MVSWWFKSLARKKSTNLVVFNALPVVVDYCQCIMLKTSSLCTVKKTALTAIVLSDRQHVKHTFLTRLYITSSRKTCRSDWTLCFNFVVFQLSCMTKNEIFAQTLLHTVKQWNKVDIMEIFLYGWCPNSVPHLPAKIMNVALSLPKLLSKIYWPLFVDTLYIF